MNCEQLKTALGSYHDGELTADHRRKVREHLDGCPECKKRLSGWQEVDKVLHEYSAPRPAEAKKEEVIQEIKDSPPADKILPILSFRRIAAAAMLLVGLFVGGLVGFNLLNYSKNSQGQQSAAETSYTGFEVYEEAAGEDPVDYYFSVAIKNEEGVES
ncbi:MAG: anti-sigma factor family protein [bacterium]